MKARGCFEGMDTRFAAALSFATVELPDASLLIVATNRSARKALHAYRKRWQIECLFGDTKTRGFNMEDTRLTQAAKLSLLLGLVALAMAWSMACACAVKGRQAIQRAKHRYRRKSWFRTGFDTIRRWIQAQPDMATSSRDEFWRRARKPGKNRRVM
jgi:Transposase DDE domain